ncbi:hypothetical protein OUZ56_020662 [Daphnia magna]|uniref:Uncharacterized protein n=1 Tax=Daphnia magna TaxID=35525 RepID=A0ABQ9ZGK7_9CRUS|nr:hypothetical protein OUZ56_020662 [Daphnia magna]
MWRLLTTAGAKEKMVGAQDTYVDKLVGITGFQVPKHRGIIKVFSCYFDFCGNSFIVWRISVGGMWWVNEWRIIAPMARCLRLCNTAASFSCTYAIGNLDDDQVTFGADNLTELVTVLIAWHPDDEDKKSTSDERRELRVLIIRVGFGLADLLHTRRRGQHVQNSPGALSCETTTSSSTNSKSNNCWGICKRQFKYKRKSKSGFSFEK